MIGQSIGGYTVVRMIGQGGMGEGLRGRAQTCAARCVPDVLITRCLNGDACCAPGCTRTNDTDCNPICGNGALEGAEKCDPLVDCEARKAACTSDAAKIRTAAGKTEDCSFECTARDRPCSLTADGFCPPQCSSSQDADCKRPAGSPCSGNAECATNACVDGTCCNQTCTASCQACNLNGSVGTCSTVRSAADPGTCSGGSVCDGNGACQAICGGRGQACCSGSSCNAGSVCGNGNICVACGGAGQSCCAGSACGSGTICSAASACVVCGGAGGPCCTGRVCGGGLTCVGGQGACYPPDGGAVVDAPARD